MRVSTAGQSFDLQRDAIAKAGCERVYDDTCSGRATERPGLARALEVARAGDALVVWKLDRIGRSLPHVVQFVGDLQKRGVGLKVLTGEVDTTTPTGRLVFGIFATLAEFERDLIHERSEEHTSELQSHSDLVCRLLLEKKKWGRLCNNRVSATPRRASGSCS